VQVASLAPGEAVTHALSAGRAAWIQVVRGAVAIDAETLREGDGAAVADADGEERQVLVRAGESSDVLVFDLA
jgi:redox-sensitive bicupin YhaK (pirin superfamily)